MAVNSDRLLWRTYYVLLLFVSVDIASSVRLYGHKTKYEGGIEIYYDSQQTWNPLCGECWTNYSANAACKELGFSGGISANVPLDRKGILTARYVCPTGYETNLSNCSIDYQKACNPCTEAAGVLCAGAVRLDTLSPPSIYKVVMVFLRDRFQQYRWNSLCGECWTRRNADVTCKQLGYRGGRGSKLNVNTIAWITSYECLGNEMELTSCPVFYDRYRFCPTRAVVQCVDNGGGFSGVPLDVVQ
ncbi:neurotrypsin-like isoform X2 [Mizuhopecten yessoensis]|uniref:neurotrypsin-like isoform X2 n=1 Tax=Mizuhopecten yessoensis TaxID=6573 RepID=UPI000B459389|nr:neurotrypsin-like isoform X2 [Mizuhopecten yessoensis]